MIELLYSPFLSSGFGPVGVVLVGFILFKDPLDSFDLGLVDGSSESDIAGESSYDDNPDEYEEDGDNDESDDGDDDPEDTDETDDDDGGDDSDDDDDVI